MSPPPPERLARVLRGPLPWLALAVAWTWPTALHPVAATPGSAHTDLWEGLWSLWFVATRLANGALPLHTEGLLDPGGSLWPADMVSGVLLAPVTLTAGPAVAWSLLVVGHLALRGWLGFALGARYAGSSAAGVATGVVLALAPVGLSAVHNGATEALGDTWTLAVALVGLQVAPGDGERGRVVPGWRWVTGAGVLLAASALAHWYGGVGAFALWGVLGLRSGLARAARARFALALVLGALLTAPVAWEARAVSTAHDNVVGLKTPAQLARLRRTIGPADPAAFVLPAPYRSPDFRKIGRFGEDYWHSPYLGWTALALAALGLRARGARWAWALVPLGIGLALGPVLTHGGSAVILPGQRAVPLPYFLVDRLPPFDSLALVWRFGWLAQVGVALSAAQGVGVLVARSPRAARWWTGGIALAVGLEAALVAPTRGLPGHVDASARGPVVALANEPPGTVMTWPAIGALPTLYEQVTHGHALAASLNFPASRASMQVAAAVKQGREATIAVARRTNVRYVVLHLDARADADPQGPELADWERFPVLAEDEAVRVLKLW